MTRFDKAIALIDAAHAADPSQVEAEGALAPAELVYARRMTAALAGLHPEASELLKLAVRAQHLGRWTIPRASYPEGRAGYYRWRNDLKARHAETASALMAEAGYGVAEQARVAALIRKQDLAADPEAQALEDAACLVFLKHYAADFAGKHDDAKLSGILLKTWRKMSPLAHGAAGRLPLGDRLVRLLEAAVRSAVAEAG